MKFKKFIKESFEDMDRHCPECNTLLNDVGTCPKCDDGEEDYGDEIPANIDESCDNYHIKKYGAYWFGITGPDQLFMRKPDGKLQLFRTEDEAQQFIDNDCKVLEESTQHTELSNKEKLMRAFPGEFNFDTSTSITEDVQQEELTNREKLLKAFPELNFKEETLQEDIKESLTNREKLEKAYPGVFDFDDVSNKETMITETIEGEESYDYDDDYDFDDIEEDRRHAALYGGDLTYCKDCGTRLKRNEWGGYCPECNPEEI